MNSLYLIDTSLWTCALRRKGEEQTRQHVQNLVRSGRAGWCDAVRLELWRGAGSDSDRQVLKQMEAEIPSFQIDAATWNTACELADIGRRKGLQFPSLDLLIFACAKQHSVELLTRDKHFEQLTQLWKHL